MFPGPSVYSMSDSVEAVLFDVDGTLCEYQRGTAQLLAAAFERAAVEPFFSAAVYESRYDEFTDDSSDMQDLRERCFAAIARDDGRDPEVGRAVAKAYAAERDHGNVQFLDGVPEVLDTLDRRYRLAAVTNGAPEMQSRKLDALGIDCFETIVYAGYDTPAKPDPEPFAVALDAVETAPRRAIYVGNSLEADVAGAKAAGLRAAWIGAETRTTLEPTPDFVIDSPRGLLDCPWTTTSD